LPPSRFYRHLVHRHLAILGLGVIFWPSIAAQAAIVLTVRQDGNDVIVVGSGSANINGLPTPDQNDDYTNVLTDTQIYAGPAAFTDDPTTPDVAVNLWSGITGPTSFGNHPNVFENPSSGFDDLFGIVADNGFGQSLLVLPLSYQSGASLSGTSRFNNFTLADLGLNPGVFSWNWGMGQNADSLQLRIEPVPVPAPLPLAGGLMAWSMAKRMRRASRDRPIKDTANTQP
jgi:hypothetical protein